MRIALSLLLLATVLLLSSAAVADAAFVSCALASVTVFDSSHNVIYTRSSFSTSPVYTVTLPTAITSTVYVSQVYAEPTVATGSLRVYGNTVLKGTTTAPSSAEITVSPLSVAPAASNVIRVRSRMEYDSDYITETCDYSYYFTFINPSAIVGDPQFAGLRGQSYQVHGIDGAVYALISAPDYLMNSRFQFLDGPRPCPTMPTTGRKSLACWSHPGSYLGEVGLATSAGQALEVVAGAADAGFTSVQLNGRALSVGDVAELVGAHGVLGSVVRNSTHELTVNVGPFNIELENNDFFVNLRAVRVLPSDWPKLSAQRVHGLLGQTWQSRRYAGSVKEIEGEVDDYVVEEDTLVGHNFVYDRFRSIASA